MNIKDYYLVESISAEEMSGQVTRMILRGWVPFGSPSCFYKGGFSSYTQAMVKYEE